MDSDLGLTRKQQMVELRTGYESNSEYHTGQKEKYQAEKAMAEHDDMVKALPLRGKLKLQADLDRQVARKLQEQRETQSCLEALRDKLLREEATVHNKRPAEPYGSRAVDGTGT